MPPKNPCQPGPGSAAPAPRMPRPSPAWWPRCPRPRAVRCRISTRRPIAATASAPQRRFEVLLAETGGRPAGYALFHPSYDTDRVVRAAYLGDLYVEAWARGSGLGRLLAASVARLAAAAGDENLHWTVLRRNTAARRFYARFAREDDLLLHCFADAPALARLAAASPLSATSIRPAKAGGRPPAGRFSRPAHGRPGRGATGGPAAAPRLADHGFGADPRFQALIAEAGAGVGASGGPRWAMPCSGRSTIRTPGGR